MLRWWAVCYDMLRIKKTVENTVLINACEWTSYNCYIVAPCNRLHNHEDIHRLRGHMVHCVCNDRYIVHCNLFRNVQINILKHNEQIMIKPKWIHFPQQLSLIFFIKTTEYIKICKQLLLLQSLLSYPGVHPISQWPVCLLHGELFRQWPLQLWTQLYP